MEDNRVRVGGIGICDVLAIVFIVLKLCGVITWSRIWVLAPIWIPLCLVIIFLIIFAIYIKRM